MDGQLTLYRVRQLESTRTGGLYNDDVIANRAPSVRDGIVVHGQRGRQNAVIGGEIQEITPLADGRVLMRKDVLLEDSRRRDTSAPLLRKVASTFTTGRAVT